MRTAIRGVITQLLLSLAALATPGVQAQQVLLPASPANSNFGDVLAAHGRDLAVRSFATGSIDIYRRYEDAWWPVQQLVAAPGVTEIGYRLAMGSHWLAVASRDGTAPGWPNYVDLYRREGAAWSFVQRLDSPAEGMLGYVERLAVSDTALMVGTSRYISKTLTTYQVYVFDRSADGWGPAQMLAGPAGSTDQFGYRFAVSDEVMIVSDPLRAPDGMVASFTRTNGAWVHASLLAPPSQVSPRSFGRSLALCGTHLIVQLQSQFGAVPPFDTSRVAVFTGGPQAWALGGEVVSPESGDYSFGQRLGCSEGVFATRGSSSQYVYAASLHDRQLRPLQVSGPPLPYGYLCMDIAVDRGDVICSSSIESGLPAPLASTTGVVYAFNDAIDAIFLQGFDSP